MADIKKKGTVLACGQGAESLVDRRFGEALRDGIPVIITDGRGYYRKRYESLCREAGADVHVFNFSDPEHSDSWDCIRGIDSTAGRNFVADVFASVCMEEWTEHDPDLNKYFLERILGMDPKPGLRLYDLMLNGVACDNLAATYTRFLMSGTRITYFPVPLEGRPILDVIKKLAQMASTFVKLYMYQDILPLVNTDNVRIGDMLSEGSVTFVTLGKQVQAFVGQDLLLNSVSEVYRRGHDSPALIIAGEFGRYGIINGISRIISATRPGALEMLIDAAEPESIDELYYIRGMFDSLKKSCDTFPEGLSGTDI